jgi:predicted CopG family antitoxin
VNSDEEIWEKAKQRCVNDIINNAPFSDVVLVLIKDANIRAETYLKTLSQKEILELSKEQSSASQSKPKTFSLLEKVSALATAAGKALGIKPKRKGFITKSNKIV